MVHWFCGFHTDFSTSQDESNIHSVILFFSTRGCSFAVAKTNSSNKLHNGGRAVGDNHKARDLRHTRICQLRQSVLMMSQAASLMQCQTRLTFCGSHDVDQSIQIRTEILFFVLLQAIVQSAPNDSPEAEQELRKRKKKSSVIAKSNLPGRKSNCQLQVRFQFGTKVINTEPKFNLCRVRLHDEEPQRASLGTVVHIHFPNNNNHISFCCADCPTVTEPGGTFWRFFVTLQRQKLWHSRVPADPIILTVSKGISMQVVTVSTRKRCDLTETAAGGFKQ